MSEHVNVAEVTTTTGAGPIASPDPVRELLVRVRGIVVGADEAIEHYNATCEQYFEMCDRLDRAAELLHSTHEQLETSSAILRATAQARIVSTPTKSRAKAAPKPATAPASPG